MAHIVVATPMYGGQCHGDYMESVMALKEEVVKAGHSFSFLYVLNESLIQRARNTLVWYFMQGDGTHLLFIDADISFRPQDAMKMLEANVDLIGGIYPKKRINWEDIQLAVDKGQKDLQKFSGDFVVTLADNTDKIYFDQPLPVKHLGTGFMMIKREVFEKLKPFVGSYISNNHTSDRGSELFNYFQVTVRNDELLLEDYFFCRMFQDIGGISYAAPWCEFVHNGNYRFNGTFVEHLKVHDPAFYK